MSLYKPDSEISFALFIPLPVSFTSMFWVEVISEELSESR